MPIQTHPNPTSHASILLLCLSLLLSHSATAQKPPPSSPPSSEYNFSPPMATAVIILIIFFFSVGFISVYIRHFMLCLGYTPGRGFNGGIEAWRNERSPRGLDPKIVDMFPTFLYSDVKMHRIGKSLLECAICLNEFTDLETLRMLPSCSHVFHPHCVGPWLASHVTCPVCRANLENQSSDRSLSFNYLTQQFEQSSSEEDEIESSRNNHDVIVRVGTSSPEDNKVITITSPVIQEITRMDGPVIKLPRSHSTGHSLVENCERYTLRLPDEIRNKLVNAKLSGLPAAIVSPPVGYRARSIGCQNIGVEGVKPDHWRFSVSPPFISRASSTKSQKSNDRAGNNSNNESNNNNDNNNSSIGTTTSPMNLLKSIKSSFNRADRSDDTGERSTNRLWVSRTSQDLELEAQWHHDQ